MYCPYQANFPYQITTADSTADVSTLPVLPAARALDLSLAAYAVCWDRGASFFLHVAMHVAGGDDCQLHVHVSYKYSTTLKYE